MVLSDFSHKIDIIMPAVTFIVLVLVGLYVISKNGQWWADIVQDYMPNKNMYYALWCLFLIIYPIAYIFALGACFTRGQRIFTHLVFLGIALFIILWCIYIYQVRDVNTASIFLYVTIFLSLVGVVFLWFLGSNVAGVLLLLALWLSVTLYLTKRVSSQSTELMINTLRDRFNSRNKPPRVVEE